MDVESPSELVDQAGHREEAGAAAENPPSGTAHGLGRYAMATEEVTKTCAQLLHLNDARSRAGLPRAVYYTNGEYTERCIRTTS